MKNNTIKAKRWQQTIEDLMSSIADMQQIQTPIGKANSCLDTYVHLKESERARFNDQLRVRGWEPMKKINPLGL